MAARPPSCGSRSRKHGYLGVNIPEEFGGGGGGIGDVAAVCEELAAQGCPLLMMVVSPAICGTVIARYGTDEQKQSWLPGIARRHRDDGVRDHRAGRRHQLAQHHHDRPPGGRGLGAEGPKIYISGVDEADERARRGSHRGRQDRHAQALPVRRPTDAAGLRVHADPDGDRQPRAAVHAVLRRRPAARRRARRRRGRRPRSSCSTASTRSGSWAPRSRPGRPLALDKAVAYANEREVFGRPDRQPPGHRAPAGRRPRSRSSWPA